MKDENQKKMKTTQHEFSLDLYNKAIENPTKYEFVYRDGRKPLGVFYMKRSGDTYKFMSYSDNSTVFHHDNGFFHKNETHTHTLDLFILEKGGMTYREALESLPDGYRELAIANAEEQKWRGVNPNDECIFVSEAINHCFVWSKTPEKGGFWNAVYRHYQKNQPLPPLPVKEEKGGVQETVADVTNTPDSDKTIDYWKNNAAENYTTTPISVLRYISELEECLNKKPVAVDGENAFVPKHNQERLDRFVCAYIAQGMLTIGAILEAKETLKQLEGGEG